MDLVLVVVVGFLGREAKGGVELEGSKFEEEFTAASNLNKNLLLRMFSYFLPTHYHLYCLTHGSSGWVSAPKHFLMGT